MNKVFLIGNLTKDPELSETQSGVAYCRMSIAVNRPYADGNGERQVDFFNVIAWRGQAENCGKFLSKGKKIAIVGSIQNRSYEDKDGVKRTVTDIIANEVEFLSPRTEGDQAAKAEEKPTLVPSDDDLPF